MTPYEQPLELAWSTLVWGDLGSNTNTCIPSRSALIKQVTCKTGSEEFGDKLGLSANCAVVPVSHMGLAMSLHRVVVGGRVCCFFLHATPTMTAGILWQCSKMPSHMEKWIRDQWEQH